MAGPKATRRHASPGTHYHRRRNGPHVRKRPSPGPHVRLHPELPGDRTTDLMTSALLPGMLLGFAWFVLFVLSPVALFHLRPILNRSQAIWHLFASMLFGCLFA